VSFASVIRFTGSKKRRIFLKQFFIMVRNSISSSKCPKMATQFNDVASAKKASAIAVGGMWRWSADSAAGRISIPEWHSTQVQQFSK
jgi:hypothetical protein